MTAAGAAPVVPELGPLLGRLTETVPPRAQAPAPFDDIRYALVSEIFELGAAAREFAESGDWDGAAASLGRRAWLDAWERAVTAVAARVATRIDARMRAAAAESLLPTRQLERLLLDDEERRAIGVRLGISGGPFVGALDALESTVPAAARGPAALARWQEALGGVARRVESAWLALDRAASEELAAWTPEIERVRAWRRPRWPLWLVSVAVLGIAGYVGLVLGGFFPVPGPLHGMAAFWWARM